MYDMKELEKKWFKYKIKQSVPWLIVLMVVLLMILYYNNRVRVNGILSHYYHQISTKYFPKKVETNSTIVVENNSSKVTQPPQEKQVTKEELNVSDEIFETNDTIYETNSSNPFFSSIKDAPKVDKKTPEEKLEDEIEKRHEKKYVYIKKSSDAYKEVEKRFATSQDPEDALFLARVYYEMKNYKKAEEWAFIANELNDESEESWLIYAKAKAARGEHLKAIHILDSYLKKTNSLRARKLLEEYKAKLSKK
ncbi:MAG: CDC27 family protein [Campylobacterales bacterium]|nr:CDC27 family protein [Campylobacterales bacterium]